MTLNAVTRSLLAFATLAALSLLPVVAATAKSGGTRGRLTASEYRQLQRYDAAATQPNPDAVRLACLGPGTSTQLLSSTRESCLAELVDQQVTLTLQSNKCNGTVLAQLICMDPAFQRLAREVPHLRTADLALRAVGLARGFIGNCLLSLVATKGQIATEKLYIEAAQRTAREVAALVEAAKTRTPSSAMMQRVGDDETMLDQARDNWFGEAIAYPLSVCPHG